MKSYITDMDNPKEFLNSFKFDQERNLLILEYASGDILPVNCTRKNMIKILEKMKKQVRDSFEFEQKVKRKFNIAVFMSSLALFMLVLLIVIPNLPILLLITSIITLYISTNNLVKSNNMLRDIKKNKLFLKHSNDITAAMKNLTSHDLSNMIDSMTLQNVSIQNDSLFYMGLDDIPPININSIDDISLDDMNQIIKTLKIKPKK